jgi:hypothetical protein
VSGFSLNFLLNLPFSCCNLHLYNNIEISNDDDDDDDFNANFPIANDRVDTDNLVVVFIVVVVLFFHHQSGVCSKRKDDDDEEEEEDDVDVPK